MALTSVFIEAGALRFGFLTPLPAHSSSLNLASRNFVTLVYVFAWRFAHRIGRQGTTRSEMSRAAPGQPVYSSSQVFSLTHTVAHLCLVPCTATLPRLPAHFPAPAASALAHALQVISVALCDVDGRTHLDDPRPASVGSRSSDMVAAAGK
ncbi:hypothetical protein B0H13DRAFT_2676929 [Mycena leptocephala]|nr:hypothetical protein B0H13DRAFT_2676929 [Mycena leptocephala]